MTVHIFDCDGVITDTNDLKTVAFEKTAKKHLPDQFIPSLLDFHLKNGGKSRWEKFGYIKEKFSLNDLNIDELCQDFSEFVESSMYEKDLIPSVKKYINKLNEIQEDCVYVASAGELNQVKKLIKFHDLKIPEENIYGSPSRKNEIVKNIKKHHKNENFILYGDSKHDAECASEINAKFIFIFGYTNVKKETIEAKYSIDLSIRDFSDLSYKELKFLF